MFLSANMGRDVGVSGDNFTMNPVYGEKKTWKENTCLRNSVLCDQNINVGNNVPKLCL